MKTFLSCCCNKIKIEAYSLIKKWFIVKTYVLFVEFEQ